MKENTCLITICNNCGSDQSKIKYQVDGFDIVRCCKCGFTYLRNPLPTSQEDQLYDDYYEKSFNNKYHQNTNDSGLKTLWEINNERLKTLKKIYPNGTLLDVGSGQGFFLYHAKQVGFSVKGLDISAKAVEFSRSNFDIEVYQQNINKGLKIARKFDIITLWHILEHVSDPVRFLKNLKNNLAQNGILVIEVPNIHSLKFLFANDSNRWIGGNHPRHHKFFFSFKTLKSILLKAGFDRIEKLSINYNISRNSTLKSLSKKVLKKLNVDSFINVCAYK